MQETAAGMIHAVKWFHEGGGTARGDLGIPLWEFSKGALDIEINGETPRRYIETLISELQKSTS